MPFEKDMRLEGLRSLKKKIMVILFFLAAASIVTAMIVIALLLRNTLADDGKARAHEISLIIRNTLKNMMIKRTDGLLQETMEEVVKDGYLSKAFIIDRSGRIAYSSERSEVGRALDKSRDPSCIVCHAEGGISSGDTSVIIQDRDRRVQRNVSLISNEKKCYSCHPPDHRTNGKLILDMAMDKADSLVFTVEMTIFISGLFCLPLLFLLISWGVNKYMERIQVQYNELSLLYSLVERISKVIDLYELKDIVLSILHQTSGADEVVIVIPFSSDFRATVWSPEQGRGVRLKVEPVSTLGTRIRDWLGGKELGGTITRDMKEIYYPVMRKDERIALIYLRRDSHPFNGSFMRLMNVIGGHISVAFENAMLYRIAITDDLTGLFSYRYFRECLIRLIASYEKNGDPGAMLMLDIDNYKSVNDRHGHLAGDTVLKEVALCIFDTTRDSDMAFRYGGEEFTVLLPATGEAEAFSIAERIRTRIEGNLFLPGELDLRMTISIGVSACPENARGSRELIYTADQALYEAKRRGKNCTVMSKAKPAGGKEFGSLGKSQPR